MLGGSLLNNAGLIQGDGIVAAPLVNSPGGQIALAAGDWLTLRNLSLNQGSITNLGGILDLLGASFTNAGVMSGYGNFWGNAMVNQGSVSFRGGAASVYGNYLNTTGATTVADGVTASFYGTVTNSGTMQGINGGALRFYGTVVNNVSFRGVITESNEGNNNIVGGAITKARLK